MEGTGRTVLVTGATGRQGGAVARHLLARGWRVRALTRSPDSKPARALQALGAQVVRGDMSAPDDLHRACAGVHGVFSVQNPMTSGPEGEVVQGMNVVDAAAEAGVSHLVYGSAGPGTPGTGVASWDDKLKVVQHAQHSGLPLTVLRSMAFMELMTDRDLYPPVTVWHLMPRLVGGQQTIPWLSADDVGAMAARAFAHPASYVGSDLSLAGDCRTLLECRDAWRLVTGRNPRRVPVPLWLFERFVGPDLTRMWRWLATHEVNVDPAETRAHIPGAATVEDFLTRRTGRGIP